MTANPFEEGGLSPIRVKALHLVVFPFFTSPDTFY